MPRNPSNIETEIKLRLPGAVHGGAMLRRAGLRLKRRRAFESNFVLDAPGGGLRRQGALLRVREYGSRNTLTYKGPASPGRHKSREEVEVTFSGLSEMTYILDKLGYEVMFRYEKYRTEYTDDTGVAMVDETPIGDFLELEGSGEWIDELARRLGYSHSDYETRSYGSLFQEYCREMGEGRRDMVFPTKGESKKTAKARRSTRRKRP